MRISLLIITASTFCWRFVVDRIRRSNAPEAPPQRFDFCDAETAFRCSHDVGLTESGKLAVRKRGEGGFKMAREREIARWLHGYLVGLGLSRFYDGRLPGEFGSWLESGAEPLPQGTAVRS